MGWSPPELRDDCGARNCIARFSCAWARSCVVADEGFFTGTVYVVNYPWRKYLTSNADEGCDVCVLSRTRPAPNTLPMAKAGANYMNSQLIKMAAIVNGYDMGMFKSRVTNR